MDSHDDNANIFYLGSTSHPKGFKSVGHGYNPGMGGQGSMFKGISFGCLERRGQDLGHSRVRGLSRDAGKR